MGGIRPVVRNYDCGFNYPHDHEKTCMIQVQAAPATVAVPDPLSCYNGPRIEEVRRPRHDLRYEGELVLVTGTYNRLAALQDMIHSLEDVIRMIHPVLIVVDGGSTDGTIEWLEKYSSPSLFIRILQQQLPLKGAVSAFNEGFEEAVYSHSARWIGHLNDDIVLKTPGMLDEAVEHLLWNPSCGEVAFEHDLRGTWGFDRGPRGILYANFGIARVSAARMVASMYDREAVRFWNPIYRTYAADTEFGMWLHELGWTIHQGKGLRIHDVQVQDQMRIVNTRQTRSDGGDSSLFHKRWKDGPP